MYLYVMMKWYGSLVMETALKGMHLWLKERDFAYEKGNLFEDISKNTICF